MTVWFCEFLDFVVVVVVVSLPSSPSPPLPNADDFGQSDFPKFFVPEERDTEKGWGIREVKRTAKKIQKKKKLPQIFSYTTTRGSWV